jgi:hypothetical protein
MRSVITSQFFRWPIVDQRKRVKAATPSTVLDATGIHTLITCELQVEER